MDILHTSLAIRSDSSIVPCVRPIGDKLHRPLPQCSLAAARNCHSTRRPASLIHPSLALGPAKYRLRRHKCRQSLLTAPSERKINRPQLSASKRSSRESCASCFLSVRFRPDHKVPMIRHHHIVEDPNRHPLPGFRQHPFKSPVVVVLLKQRQPSKRTVQAVKDGSGRAMSSSARHPNSITAALAAFRVHPPLRSCIDPIQSAPKRQALLTRPGSDSPNIRSRLLPSEAVWMN